MCETVSPGRAGPVRASTLHAVKETVEREVKLAAGEGFTLPELGGEVRPTRIFVSTYHDTADLALARHGITFRHRVEDGAGVWQLKLPRAGETRVELERGGPPAVPPPELAGLLAALLRTGPLVPVARLRTRREVVRASGAEVVDDSVAVLDRQRVTRRFREIEVELLDGDEDTLRRLEQALRRAGADGGDFTPKLYRALDLVYPSEPLTVPEDAAPAEALALRLREQATALVSRDPGTRLGSDPEDLHQLRVATRRLRAYLRAARPLLAAEPADELRAELGWLGGALGPVRDLDVLMEHFGQQPDAAGLVSALQERRTAARAGLLEALGSDRYLALLDRLDAYTASPPLAGGGETLAAIWWVEAKRLRRAVEALGDAPEDEALHAVRIKVKRARYAAELAGHELGERGARYVARAKQAQDVLGAHQDASVAEAEIHAWAAGRPELAEAAGRLAAAERERRREARAAWPEAWERLARAARRARR
jgi:CHAD domain-containing protein